MTGDPPRQPDDAGHEATDRPPPPDEARRRDHDRPPGSGDGRDADPPPDPDAPTDDVWVGNTLREAAPGD